MKIANIHELFGIIAEFGNDPYAFILDGDPRSNEREVMLNGADRVVKYKLQMYAPHGVLFKMITDRGVVNGEKGPKPA